MSEAKKGGPDLSALLYAETDDGVKGVVRDVAPKSMKMNNGMYFIPIEDDAKLHRAAINKLLDAIDNHHPDSPEFASLYIDAKEMIGI